MPSGLHSGLHECIQGCTWENRWYYSTLSAVRGPAGNTAKSESTMAVETCPWPIPTWWGSWNGGMQGRWHGAMQGGMLPGPRCAAHQHMVPCMLPGARCAAHQHMPCMLPGPRCAAHPPRRGSSLQHHAAHQHMVPCMSRIEPAAPREASGTIGDAPSGDAL